MKTLHCLQATNACKWYGKVKIYSRSESNEAGEAAILFYFLPTEQGKTKLSHLKQVSLKK